MATGLMSALPKHVCVRRVLRLPVVWLLATALFCCVPIALSKDDAAQALPRLPLTQDGGRWDAGHVQGIAVDRQNGYVYYSFTTLLAKFDFNGKLIGTLVGWTGHLGDLDFNTADGKVYGSLEYKDHHAFYVAIIDVARIDRVGMQANETDLLRSVYLPEVAADYTADIDGDGGFDGNVGDTADHRYGCSGIDGVGFGPAFGRIDGTQYLTVAYGIYGNSTRSDNDHQVLLQYDIRDWDRYALPLSESAPHRSGPARTHGKYFLRTGNTTYGVQTLAYDEAQQRWFLGVYRGKKPAFPNYSLFAVDAKTAPVSGDLIGVPALQGHGWEQGQLLTLAGDGLRDAATGIRGWQQKADVGVQPVGNGQFYLATNLGGKGAQGATLQLMQWTGDLAMPFMAIEQEPQP